MPRGRKLHYTISTICSCSNGISRGLSKWLCQTLRMSALAIIVTTLGTGLVLASPMLDQMYHRSWTVRQGAPQDIYAIAQTADGFLWFGTQNGLFRFDGASFERYQPVSGDPFPGTQVQALKATSDGGLWIGYGRVGISFLKQGHNTNYGEQAGIPRTTIFDFAVDFDEGLWALGRDLMRFDGTKWRTIGEEWGYPADRPPRNLFVDSRGTLWVGTNTGLLYLRRGEHAFRSVNDVTWWVRNVFESPDGTLWLCSMQAPVRALDPVTAALRKDISPIEYRTWAIWFARDQSIWIMNPDHGLARFDSLAEAAGARSTEHAQTYTEQMGLSSNRVYRWQEDREGSIWVVTTKGIDQFRKTAFDVLTLPDRQGQFTAAVAPDPGQMFIGANIVEIATGRLIAPRPASVSEDIFVIYRDPDNSLWFGGTRGLWRFVDHHFVTTPLPHALLGADRIQAIAKDHAGNLWISITTDGVYRRVGEVWTRMNQLAATRDNLCLSVMVDSHGRIWFTYAKSDTVQMLDGDRLSTYGEKEGLDLGYTTTLSEVGGNVVVGGETGLEVLAGDRFRRLHLDDGGTIEAVTGVLQQKNGDLWINQASGILQIKAADIARALSDPGFEMPFKRYDYLDGLNRTSAPPSPLATIVDSGEGFLYFVMQTTVYALDTEHIPHNSNPPAVAIQSLSDGKQEYRDQSRAVLPENTDTVTIRFTASSLAIPERVKFRYRLAGIDRDWQSDNGQRLAVYSRLPPGQYAFQVIASNNDGVWNEEGVSVHFTIPPSFVQSAGFKVLCAAVAGGALWVIYRIRLHQISAQVRRRMYERLDERTRIARDLHDTFFQGIQGLLLRFNTALSLLDKDGPTARMIMQDTLEKSDRVMLQGRELMLDLREGAGKTTELADALSHIGEDLQKDHPAEFHVTVIGDPRPLHPLVFEELHRFGQEALANAFRHAHAKAIEVELHYERNQLRLRVRDDGVGIDPAVLSSGSRAGHWGLPGMRERAKQLGGSVDIWSRANAGTEIELRIPAAAAYQSRAMRSPFAWLIRRSNESKESNQQ